MVHVKNFSRILEKIVNFQKENETIIYKCNCQKQLCKGKFVRKYKWQTYCSWEMLRLGLIKDVNELVKGKSK